MSGFALAFGQNRSARIMLTVLACLLPGMCVSALLLGSGVLVNCLVACVAALAMEGVVLRLRGRTLNTIGVALCDGSALVTGLLLGLALSPTMPVWLVAAGAGFAILFGKQLYGGLGHNPFNPAMVGYAALIVSFPLQMSTWPELLDGSSGATALDTFRQRGASTISEVWIPENGFGYLGDHRWEWINLAFLAGGVMLIFLKAARWQAPVGMLATLVVLSVLFYDSGSSQSLGSPLFHLFSGGTMLGAFFILTDPVSSPDTPRGLLLFGVGVGVIVFIIRAYGAYPDGLAFGVLLMNAVTPLAEQLRVSRR